MSEVSFTALAARHALSGRAQGHSPATLVWYQMHLRTYDQWRIGAALPDVIPTDEMLERFIADEQSRQLSPSTVNGRFRALRAVLRYGEARKLITRDQNPTHTVRAPRIPRLRPRHATLEDLKMLLASIHGESWVDHRDRLILQLLYFSGLRVGELCGLHVEDIDLQRKEVFVRRGKGSKPRMVPINPELRPTLLSYLFSRPSTSTHLLLGTVPNREECSGPLKTTGIRQILRRRCLRAGIEHLSPHTWRHGFAIFLRNNGTDLSDIAAAMGHTTTQVTQLYYAFTLAPAVHKAYDRALERMRSGE